MKKFSRILLALLTFALALLPLAGCGAKPGEDIGGEISEQQPESRVEPDTGTEAEAIVFSSSDGIGDNGYWVALTARDHVELYDFQAMTIPADTHTVSDESVRDEVNSILASYSADRQVTDRPIADGDTVNIDYVGSVDGVEFQGGTTGGAGTDVTIGVTSYIDDFLEQLIGHTPGETVNVEVTFPEEYGVDDLNGKDALFVTEINYIVETVTPELSDSFVAENLLESSGWSTVEELNRGISQQLQTAAILSYTQDYLMDHVTFLSLPDALLTYMENSIVSYYQELAEGYGVEVGEILAMYEGVSTVGELIERYHDSNVEQANYSLAIQAIAEEAGITAADTDVAAYFANHMGVEDYSQYEAEYGMPYLKQVALNRMVLEYLADQAELE